MTSASPTRAEAAAQPDLHFKKDDLLHDSSLITNLKEFKKKTTIRAVQVACPFDVETLEGTMRGKALDWLAVGVNGELYPIGADIFAKTYEASASKDADQSKAAEKRLLEIEVALFAKAGEWDRKNRGQSSPASGFLRNTANEIHGVVNIISPPKASSTDESEAAKERTKK